MQITFCQSAGPKCTISTNATLHIDSLSLREMIMMMSYLIAFGTLHHNWGLNRIQSVICIGAQAWKAYKKNHFGRWVFDCRCCVGCWRNAQLFYG